MRVLVVEDETRLAAGLRDGMEADGFAVEVRDLSLLEYQVRARLDVRLPLQTD